MRSDLVKAGNSMIESSLDDLGIVIFRCTGSVTLDDIVVAANEVYAGAKEDQPSRALWDTRETRFEWSLEDLSTIQYKERISLANKYRSEDRIAIVVSSSIHRVITELSRDILGFEFPFEVFDSYDVAYKWLNA